MLDRALAIVLTNVTISYSIYLQYSTHIHSVTLDARAHSVALDARAHSPLRYIDVIAMLIWAWLRLPWAIAYCTANCTMQ